MGRQKILFFILAIMAIAVVLAGCTSAPAESPGKSLVVATVGAPTPAPTEPPEPTPGPTWVPTPTPVPPPISLATNVSMAGQINGDQRPVSGDPSADLQLNARYATRQDTLRFTVKNTGNATLTGLDIVYELDLAMTTVGNGQYSTSAAPQFKTESVGTLKQGETKDIEIVSPIYEAMQTVNVSITAKWDNGTLQLFRARLDPNLKGGISPSDVRAVMTYGSANN